MLMIAEVPTATETVAVTLSLTALVTVGTMLFKAGEWRGEHKGLQEKVEGLAAQIDKRFAELRDDMRDRRLAEQVYRHEQERR